jgi:D-alanyl-D-alanine carboxypeptidase/D-alanyl-D-alanine-endopeptidase (penicillin-binding protein 4)
MKHPALGAGAVFRRVCARVGLQLPAPRYGAAAGAARTLARHQSPPLHEIVAAMLRHSNNLVAELVGSAASRDWTGQVLSLRESGAAITQWWRETRPEVDWEGFNPGNHSGLTARGRTTPAQMSAILAHAAGRVYDLGGDDRGFVSLLPAAGVGGALGDRLVGPETALAVWAKTGTLHFASGLAGYLYPPSGRRLAFTIFVTDREQRRAYNPQAASQPPGQGARIADWRRRAKRLEANLVRAWMDRL